MRQQFLDPTRQVCRPVASKSSYRIAGLRRSTWHNNDASDRQDMFAVRLRAGHMRGGTSRRQRKPIGALYAHEQVVRNKQPAGESIRDYRSTHSEPIVHAFWRWFDAQLTRTDPTPKHPMSKALKYVRERCKGLHALLRDADVPIDTNHLERV